MLFRYIAGTLLVLGGAMLLAPDAPVREAPRPAVARPSPPPAVAERQERTAPPPAVASPPFASAKARPPAPKYGWQSGPALAIRPPASVGTDGMAGACERRFRRIGSAPSRRRTKGT